MPALRHLLVAMDFSSTSMHALDHALALAGPLEAVVDVLHVYDLPRLPEGSVASTSLANEFARDAHELLRRMLVPRQSSPALGKLLLAQGDPRDAIVHAAARLRSDLIVIGTHGRQGYAHAQLGRMAEEVLRRASCAVLTVGDEAPSNCA